MYSLIIYLYDSTRRKQEKDHGNFPIVQINKPTQRSRDLLNITHLISGRVKNQANYNNSQANVPSLGLLGEKGADRILERSNEVNRVTKHWAAGLSSKPRFHFSIPSMLRL